MPDPSTTSAVKAKLTSTALALFVAILVAFVAQSALTEYVQTTCQYREPFFLFYVAHSSFSTILPLHLAWLACTSPAPVSTHLRTLLQVLTAKFAPGSLYFPTRRYLFVVVALTLGATTPGLLWYCSVSLTSISDITALWNANALWAYALAVPILGTPWSARAAFAVALAFGGTLAVVYGAAAPQSSPAPSPLLGAALSFVASVAYALYQVLYKRFVALEHHSEVHVSGRGDAAGYSVIRSTSSVTGEEEDIELDAAVTGDDLPFGLYPNALTASIGLGTFILLGPVVLFLNAPLPPDARTAIAVAGIALNGVIFNSGYLILLGMWGPVLTSVGSLLTIVLMLAYDLIAGGIATLTFWGLLGCGAIIAGFLVLAFDVVQHPKQEHSVTR